MFSFDQPLPGTAPRVVVTGAGIVTAYGLGWAANAEAFRAGRTAFRDISLFDTTRQRVHVAGEVQLPAELPATGLSPRQLPRLDRASILLLLAAVDAYRQSGWEPASEIPVVLGTTSGGMPMGETYFRQAVRTPNKRRGQPTRTLYYQSHMQGRMMLDALGLDGPVHIISNACASGACAIGQAWELLRWGAAERVFAGGYDVLSQFVFSGFDSLQSLAPKVCRPFDQNRDGLAIGEGAGVLALETLDHARRRNAEILGEVVGYAATMDKHHLTQPHPEGNAAFASMTEACRVARLAPSDIDYVNAHGTGTVLNDAAEASAINRWAADYAPELPVSSTKAGIGHLLGAAGAVEAIACLMALRGQWLPPETTLETPDPICRFQLVDKPRESRVNTVLSNSFGFGGINATLILRRWS